MKLKMLLVSMIALFVVGCASNGDIESLQSQIDVLKTSTASAIEESTAKAGAMCNAHCDKELNGKLDSLFKKSMTK